MPTTSGPNPLFLREEELRQAMEMLFVAQRDVAAQADPVLDRHGLGRAHHRVLAFVAREPGITVTALLDRLKVTKQSLSRVLSELSEGGYVEQGRGLRDRRQRTLKLTEAGAALERELSERQRALIARAYREAGAEAVEGFRRVLLGLMSEGDRARFGEREGAGRAGTARGR
ncbi:DNA-binding transcriptional regulator, MarR family [Limimonas halophila]|uniref:DNA-binding transcriptional regulator, MarR family n=1 Tax=Limimonas halophila TaxID=1082479 RepID=A0A1G7KX62_9PROT|nr:MarR family transcriptional regulator [Limimonas halophila]SDF41674.1 DNA-binding transcriptional regulator, MarR family [Limimonas halophila]